MYNQIFENEKTIIKMEFPQVKKAFLAQEEDYDLTNIVTSSRITLIDSNGAVLLDNRRSPATMDNHANRPEIMALSNQKSAESTRLSDTLGTQTYYYAEKLNDNVVLRLAITMDSIYAIVLKIIPFMIVIAVLVVILSAFISSYLTKKIIAPLYDIDEPVYDELDQFYAKIKGQERYIKKQKFKLSQKTEEFNILTQNIGDGFVLLNVNKEIVSINDKAKNIFGSVRDDYTQQNVLTLNRTDDFIAAIEKSYEGTSCEVSLEIHNKEYLLHISPVKSNKDAIESVEGVAIIIVDNTEKAQAEKVRREFSANVSHELKTPLTSILGYAELIKTGMAKTEDIQGFSEKIFTEANSLLELIEDIIKISRLDEIKSSFENEKVSLTDLIESSISRLDIVAKKKNVTIEKELSDVRIEGIKTVLDESLYNVLENAIKYNVENGNVFVTLQETNSEITVKIRDTGIGIPSDSKERIFERFYRVDKSHSSTIKGTGLGLSIVKHAIHLHGGKIAVASEVMKGTTITIIFPKN